MQPFHFWNTRKIKKRSPPIRRLSACSSNICGEPESNTTHFKKTVGITPGQYISQIKMNRARDYLYEKNTRSNRSQASSAILIHSHFQKLSRNITTCLLRNSSSCVLSVRRISFVVIAVVFYRFCPGVKPSVLLNIWMKTDRSKYEIVRVMFFVALCSINCPFTGLSVYRAQGISCVRSCFLIVTSFYQPAH